MENLPVFKLIVGLGNMGPAYVHSHHNAGFLAIDYLHAKLAPKNSVRTTPSFTYIRGEEFLLIKPTTFMNNSGGAVKNALKYFSKLGHKLTPSELLVIHDDSDLALGTWKLSWDKRAAGHRGVQSIIDSLGTQEFYRLRIGIRTKPGKAGTFVLKPISRGVERKLHSVFEEILEKVIVKE